MATESTLKTPHCAKSAATSAHTAYRFIADLWELTKPEINLLIAIAVIVGFLMARRDAGLLTALQAIRVTAGTLLVSSGAAALNQFLERHFDSRMRRTGRRPLVTGRIAPLHAALLGIAMSILGLVSLALWANRLSMFIAAATLLLYLLAYTPLKRISPLCTLIGSIPGAASPLIGWSAEAGRLDGNAWVLYALLLLWQFPHFMAIAWMYRDDYDRAGYRVLPGNESRRRFTALQAVIPAILLIPVSLVPWIGKCEGAVYLGGAICLGVTFAWLALRFATKATNVAARHLLFSSIVYLPALLLLLLLNKR